MARPKDIGTSAETAVTRVLQPYWPDAHRVVLAGEHDRGDIGNCGQFIFEVKGGQQALSPSTALLEKWMAEARVEAKNAKVRHGILVCQRAGYSAKRAEHWYAYVDVNTLIDILGSDLFVFDQQAPARFELGDLLHLLDVNHWTTNPRGGERVAA